MACQKNNCAGMEVGSCERGWVGLGRVVVVGVSERGERMEGRVRRAGSSGKHDGK